MADEKKPNWEQQVRDGLAGVAAGLASSAALARQAGQEGGRVSREIADYQTALKGWSAGVLHVRDIARELAVRKLDFEVAYTRDYLSQLLGVRQLAEALNFSDEAYSFTLREPIEILFKKDFASFCDLFGEDEIGFRARAALTTLIPPQQQFDMTLHFAFGLDLSREPARLYVAHDPHLRDTALGSADVAGLEGLITREIRKRVEAMTFPVDTSGLNQTGKVVRLTTSRITSHASVFGTIVPAQEGGRVKSHPYLRPLALVPSDAHSVVRFTPSLLFEFMKRELQKLVDDWPSNPIIGGPVKYSFKIEEPAESVVTDPAAPARRALRIATKAYCDGEFGAREDFGPLTLTVRLDERRAAAEDRMDLLALPILDTSRLRVIPHLPADGPAVTLMSFPKARRVRSEVQPEEIAVSVQYEA